MREAVAAVRAVTDRVPRLALVLGSGLGELAEAVEDPVIIPAADIPGYPAATVQGHQGRLVFGTLEGCEVLFVQGRAHMYEGHSLERVTFPIRLTAALGARQVLLTNAAGGINRDFPPGTLMWINGHIDWIGPRPDLKPPPRIERSDYDKAWLLEAGGLAEADGIEVRQGVYLWTMGPSYETKAEIRAFRALGADAVGMSTVPEARAAAKAGMRVLGLSTITNPAAGLNSEPLGHDEVVETGRMVRSTLIRLIGLVARGVSDHRMIDSRPDVQDMVRLVRPEVRAAREYVVGSFPDIQVKLNQNESPLDFPEALKAELLATLQSTDLNRYPDEIPHRLRNVLADRLDHPAEGIIVGNGSNELTYTLGMCFVAPGTPVVVPRPMFALYESMIRLHGGSVVPVAPRADLSFDVDGLIAAMERTQAPLTIVTTPNNPTGLALAREELEGLIEKAPGIIVVDEAYVEFNPEGSVLDLMEQFPNLIILRTLSKAFGLAGLRLGYMVGHPVLVKELMKSRLPFMVDRIAEAAALSILEREDLVSERVRQMQAWTAELGVDLEQMAEIDVVSGRSNFVLFRTPVPPPVMLNRLAESGVLVRNMGGYPELAGYLRVTSGTPAENRLFLDALKRALNEPNAG